MSNFRLPAFVASTDPDKPFSDAVGKEVPSLEKACTFEILATKFNIWTDCNHIQVKDVDGVPGWKCLLCNKEYRHKNASKALWHLAGVAKNIKICKKVSVEQRQIYKAIHEFKMWNKGAKKPILDDIVMEISDIQEENAEVLESKRQQSGKIVEKSKVENPKQMSMRDSCNITWQVQVVYLLLKLPILSTLMVYFLALQRNLGSRTS